ncbi:ATP-binding cassette domain-containing protein, partial [Campylobacter lari]|nr:ATP-binding cassette domain-containing protein [Campylobacter lari]
MIRCINRLEEHQKGHIIVDGTELTNDLKHIETIRKDVGMVFQHFNLFPHLTVVAQRDAVADGGQAHAAGPGRRPGAGDADAGGAGPQVRRLARG